MLGVRKDFDGPWLCARCLEPFPLGVAGNILPCQKCTGAVPTAGVAPLAPGGPGTELKSLLARVGIKASPTCSCNAKAAMMDANEAREPGWCEKNIDTIVGWLREEATKRRLLFVDAAGKALVRLACLRARRRAV